MNRTDQIALPYTDDRSNSDGSQNRDDRIAALRKCLSRDRAGKTDRGTDGQVDVTAGQDAQKHTAGHDENVRVLKQQVGNVLRQHQTAARQNREEDEDHDQRERHRIFFNEFSNFHALCLLSSFLIIRFQDRSQDLLLGGVLSHKLRDDTSLVHDIDAVAHT